LNTYSKLLGLSLFALALLAPVNSLGATKLFFTGTGSGYMYLSAPAVASGTVVLPALSGGTSYLIDGTRKISTTSPLLGGGALAENLSLSLDLRATYEWKGVHDSTEATSILPNSLGLPLTCLAGSVYVNLSGASSQKLFVCETTDTWVAVGVSQASSTLPNNFTSNTNPVATDDTPTYSVGSRWINTTDDTQFVAVDVTSTAARWFRTDSGNARFSGTRKGGVLDLNYYNVAGSTADLATQINFWTNSYASPGNTVADTTIERAAGDNGLLKIVNQGDGNVLLQSGNSFFMDLDSDNDSYATKVFNIRSDIPGTSTAVVMASFRDDGGLILDNSRETEYFSKCWLESDNTTASLDQCLYASISMQDTTALQLRGSAGNVCSTRSFSDCVSGTCSGGLNNENSCDNDRDCPPDVAGTSCTQNSDCATNYECRPYPYKSFDTALEAPLGKYCTSSEPCVNNINSATATVSSDCTQTVAQYCISNGSGPYAAFYATNPYRGLSGASQQLGKIIFYTNKGAANSYEDVARLQVYASQAHTTSAFGTSLLFQTVPNGSSTLQTRFQLLGDGTSTWSSNDRTNGVQMDATGKLYKDGSGKIEADQLATTITTASTSETAVELTTDHSFSLQLDNDTDATAYFTVREGSAKDYVLTVATDGRFTAQVPNSSSTGGNGIVMSNAGILTKQNSGSIVADKASNNGALTIETTASNGDIKLTPHGTGQVIVYGATPTGQVGASGTVVITDDDTTSVQLALTSNLAGTTTPSTLTMLKRNGTTSVVAGEQLSRITSYGYENVGTAANKIAGTIGFDANQAFNDSQAGSNFVLGLTGDGANTLETRFKILGDGTSEWTTNGNVGVQMDANGRLTRRVAGGRIEATDVSATYGLTVGAGGYIGSNPNFGFQWPSAGTSVNLSTANDFLVLLDNNNNANGDEFVIYDGGQTPGSADGNGNTAEEIFSIGHDAGMTIRPDKTNGVTMTSAGVLSRLNAGSIVADKVSKATAVTIETTAGDSSITLNTHGDGSILNYGITQIEVDQPTQGNTPLVLQQNNAAAGGATTLQLRKRHPDNAQGDNEPIGAIRFYGTRNTSGTVSESAGIWTQAGEDWTDTAVGTDMLFRVTPNGSGPGTGNARFSLYSNGSSRWTKDDQTNGVTLTSAGYLQKFGTGSVIADALTGNVLGATGIYGSAVASDSLILGGSSDANASAYVRISPSNKERVEIGTSYRGYKTTVSTDAGSYSSGINGGLAVNHVEPDPSALNNSATVEISTFIGSSLGNRTAGEAGALDDNDYIGQISFIGSKPSLGADSGASIWAQASEDWTSTAGGTDLHLTVNPNGSQTVQSRFVINGDKSSTWTIDNALNGVEMTTAGVLQKKGTGSIVADKVSSATAVTIETTASNANITLDPHGTGSVNIPASNPLVLGNTNYTNPAITVDGATDTGLQFPSDDSSVALVADGGFTSAAKGSVLLVQKTRTDLISESPALLQIITRDQDALSGGSNGGQLALSLSSVASGGRNPNETDILGRIDFKGSPDEAVSYYSGARIMVDPSDEWVDGSNYESDLKLATVLSGQTTLSDRLTILSNGYSSWTKDNNTNGVEMTTAGVLQKKGTGSVVADKLNSSVTADGAVSVATGTNANFTIDPNGTGIVIVNSVGLKTINTTPSAASHWIGRSDEHGLLFDQSASYKPVLQSTTNVDVLVDSTNSGGGVAHSFNVKADAISGSDSKLIASFGQNLAAIKPDGTNGVSMTSAGLLAKAGTGSIVADRISFGTVSSDDTACTTGEVKFDATYTYFCVDGSSASQKWKRIAMSSDTW